MAKWVPFWLCGAAALYWVACGPGEKEAAGYQAAPAPQHAVGGDYVFSHRPERQARIGADACVSCHADIVDSWRDSHHAKANRLVSAGKDAAAFTPARRVEESGVTYELFREDAKFWLKVVAEDASDQRYELTGVIGETPVRQYLTEFEGNKMQTISASYDVIEDRWIDVFAGEDRRPGEWGHWTGQGMNWNANCAYCHTTELKKKFDFRGDIYHTEWTQQGISCAECHTGLEAHVEAAEAGDYQSTIPRLSRSRVDQNCAACHSRRDQLTADAFVPGDRYHDHFSLSLPDQPGLYHPDGQIRDEVFVWASFKMSRMAHAGVSCLDCHDPHGNQTILPVENNMLCMRCHEGGAMNAPVIRPTEHSFHPAGSTGNRCVECHMPKTTYMQVDPRADHGFHSPDPLMTRELGIPNACSSCHGDQSVDWAVEHAENWYGEALADSRQRRRARAIAAAYDFEPGAIGALIDLGETEEIPAWRATYAGLLANFLPNIRASAFLETLLDDDSALVRERAVGALARLEEGREFALDALGDPSRSVRLAAARSFEARNRPTPDPKAAEEWENYLAFNADRPQPLFLLAQRADREGRKGEVETYVDRAIALDRINPEMYRQAAILLSGAGLNQAARERLYTGWEIAPKNPVFPYSLGLLAAEDGDYQKAAGFLEETVALEPEFYRAWYNLSLAYQRLGRPDDAARAYQKAQGPSSPR